MSRHIVVLAPWLPVPANFGGALRTYHLLRTLTNWDEVTLLCPVTEDDRPYIAELGEICNVTTVPVNWTPRHAPRPSKRAMQVRSIGSRRSFLELSTWSEQLQRVFERLFLTTQIDLVQYESTRMAMFQPPAPCPTIVDAHDIEAELLQRVARASENTATRMLKLAEARKVEWLEERLWRSCDLAVATSHRDALAIQTASGVPARVVPNGVDVSSFERPSGWQTRRDIVFTGVMRHQPNSDAARWYLDQVHPLVRQRAPDVRAVFAGADPPTWLLDRANDDVIVTGRVDDIRPWLWSASVAIVPLRAGGGTRLKIFEAFAAGAPVVSTSIGAEGIESIAGCAILADDAGSFANAVVEVLHDEAIANRIRENARALVQQYDWTIVGRRLTDAHDEAIEQFNARQSDQGNTTVDWSGRLWRKG